MLYDAAVHDPKRYRALITPTANAKRRAKELRAQLSEPERLVLWALKNTPNNQVKFRIQDPMGPYIADFYCHPARLVIEIDGKQHTGEQIEHDLQRDEWMRSCGIEVFRIHASEVYSNLEGVRGTMIARALSRIESFKNCE